MTSSIASGASETRTAPDAACSYAGGSENNAAQRTLITAEGRLDLSTVAALHEKLSEVGCGDITLDLAGVTHFGALALQVVHAAAVSAQQRGARLNIENLSDRVKAQLAAMGMSASTLTEPAR
ncbi:STAS domain-containing protein [Sulfitobacter sp. S0837]|uniref:STAS domain-containing protein n=1 Tax=Sulfitobacter maritimus TaxID=2741719 RepID=UPI0015833608|nr:STAS domain-containing protein [Sulfitobacter maritimus]NUH64291.1 STAS domain-containing protein [Sulfitobacter maritimus]